MYTAYKLNKQGDNIQPWRTPCPIWNQFVVPCPVLTVASWPAYRFLKRQIRWSGIPMSFRIFQFIVIHTVKCFGIVNKAEIDVFLELSCFFDDSSDIDNLIFGSSDFSKTSLNIWKFTVHCEHIAEVPMFTSCKKFFVKTFCWFVKKFLLMYSVSLDGCGDRKCSSLKFFLCCSVGKVWLWSKPRILDFESQPLYLLVVWPEVISVISLSISFFHFCKGRILPLFIAERNMILYSKCLVENQYYLFVCFSILWAFIYQNPQKLLGK